MGTREFTQLQTEMMEYAYHKRMRNSLIRRGLDAKMPVERICTVMDVSRSTVNRVKVAIRKETSERS